MKALKTINLKEDYVFKYVFGKDDVPNRAALKSLISDFTECEVNDLKVLSPELKCGTKYEKNTLFDIYAEFDHGKKIDVEMQMIDKKGELTPRMCFYLGKMLASQNKKGESYYRIKECYILLLMNFKMYYDTQLFHEFGIYTEDGTSFDEEKQFVHIITVELPKVKGIIPKTNIELWAYTIYYSHDESKLETIDKIRKEKEGIAMALEAANQITQEEKEWFDNFQTERSQMEEASFDQRILDKQYYTGEQVGYEKGHTQGHKEGVDETLKQNILAIQDILSAEEIAKRFKVDIAYIKSFTESK